MKILEVIAIFQRAAGTSVFCAETARELLILGHEVRIAIPDVHADGLYETSVPCVTITEAMRENWDVVHLHGIWTPILTRVQRWATAKRIPLVWSPHGMLQARALLMKWPKKLIGLVLYQWWALHRANIIHVCSESERQNVARLHFGVPMVTIPLGITTGRHEIDNRQEKPRKVKTILYLGRINRGKGLMNLLHAWNEVLTQSPDLRQKWRIQIVGYNEWKHLSELKTEAARLQITDTIEFHGPAYGADKDAFYATADLFVLPSLSENFSSVLLDALAWGVPVITTDGTPWPMLPKIGCGWYVPVGVSGLVTALSKALALSDDRLRAMGAKGASWATATFSWSAIAQRVERMYRAGKNLLRDLGALYRDFDQVDAAFAEDEAAIKHHP